MENGNLAEWTSVSLQIAGAIAIALFSVGLWMINKAMVTRKDFEAWSSAHEAEHEALEARLTAADVRFTHVETTLSHMPTKSDVEVVRAQVGRVEGAVQGLTAGMDGLSRAIGSVGDQLNILLSTHIR